MAEDIEGIEISDELLRDHNSYIKTRQTATIPKELEDKEIFATVRDVYLDLTADVDLGVRVQEDKNDEITGANYKRVPIRLHIGGDKEGKPYGSIKLPQKGDLVILKFLYNRSYPIIDRTVFIRSGSKEYKAVRKDVLAFMDSVLDWIEYHPSGTKWKVKENGDFTYISVSGIEIEIVGKVVKIKKADNIELGETALEALVKGDSFKTLYNAHTHPTPAGPSSVPVVLMSATQLSAKNKTE